MIKKKRFSRNTNVRNALFKALLKNLIINKRIKTSEAKAKTIKPKIEKLVTLAKKKTLASKKLIGERLSSFSAAKDLEKIAEKYGNRSGGYTRILKIGQRKSDGAKMAIIEFV